MSTNLEGEARVESGAQARATADLPRDDGVTLLAVYHFVLGGIFLLATLGFSIPVVITAIVGITEESDAFIATFILLIIAAVMMIFCVTLLILGYGLWKQKQWARVASMALAVLSLVAFPIGTVAGGLTLWHLTKPAVAKTCI